jgi:hypothetical protein
MPDETSRRQRVPGQDEAARFDHQKGVARIGKPPQEESEAIRKMHASIMMQHATIDSGINFFVNASDYHDGDSKMSLSSNFG